MPRRYGSRFRPATPPDQIIMWTDDDGTPIRAAVSTELVRADAAPGSPLLGAVRQFVPAPEAGQRLPELALITGAILNDLAAALPAAPTGFWDRRPRLTSPAPPSPDHRAPVKAA